MEIFIQTVETQGLKLIAGIIIIIVGLFLARLLMKHLSKNELFLKIEPTLQGFLRNLIKVLVYILVFLTAANVMGIPLTSLVTVLASAGVAVSLAMQGALSNLVGGLTLLLLKPLKAGDFVSIGSIEGTVQSIGIFYTEFTTVDNIHVSLPNSNLTNTAISNYTREGTRRIDIRLRVGYDADIDAVKSLFLNVVNNTPDILPEPDPIVKLDECSDSSMIFLVRVWCKSGNYLKVRWNLLENCKKALDAAGIEIPYPQMDVHMK